MTTRSRILSFGSAGLFVLAGVVCAVLVAGETGQVLALVLISVGLVLATALVFFEVGLSEDRERACEEERTRQTEERARETPSATRRARRRLTFERSRSHRRRMR